MRRQLLPAVKMLALMTVITGLAYPLAVTGIAQSVFAAPANGSLVEYEGRVVGSRLLGQQFDGDGFFRPRPSAVSYDPSASSGSNLGPTNLELLAIVESRADAYRLENGLAADTPVPVDAVTASASGLDPHISVANARLQAARVASARGMDLQTVRGIIRSETIESTGVLEGQASVNVLGLNIALEEATS